MERDGVPQSWQGRPGFADDAEKPGVLHFGQQDSMFSIRFFPAFPIACILVGLYKARISVSTSIEDSLFINFLKDSSNTRILLIPLMISLPELSE